MIDRFTSLFFALPLHLKIFLPTDYFFFNLGVMFWLPMPLLFVCTPNEDGNVSGAACNYKGASNIAQSTSHQSPPLSQVTRAENGTSPGVVL